MRGVFALSLVLTLGACSEGIAPSLSGALSPSPYTIIDLGTLGGASSRAHDVNAREQIVGQSLSGAGETHAFLFSDGIMQDLGTLGGTFSTADDINDAGQVAGRSTNAAGEMRAFLWTEGSMLDLGPAATQARLNERGEVAWSAAHAFLWSNGTAVDLGTLGGTFSRAAALSERGEVVGTSSRTPESSHGHAFVWRDGVMTDLGGSTTSSDAFGINGVGQIVGRGFQGGRSFATLWDAGTMTDLGTLPGDVTSSAIAINDLGWIAGESYSSQLADSPAPFRWQAGVTVPLDPGYQTTFNTQDVTAMNRTGVVVGMERVRNRLDNARAWENGVAWSLGTLGGEQSSALAINDNGTIVGRAQNGTGAFHAVAWRPLLSSIATP